MLVSCTVKEKQEGGRKSEWGKRGQESALIVSEDIISLGVGS